MSTHQVARVQEIRPVPGPDRSHAVQLYGDDSALIDALARWVTPTLMAGDTAIIVATKSHRQRLARELRLRQIDVNSAAKSGRYIVLDGAQALAGFMVGGGPDIGKFQRTIGALVAQAEANLRPGGKLAIYGEMVALLWAEGNRDATLRLEELWNELGERHAFHLLCGYPVNAFDRLEHRQLFFSMCGEHTHLNPDEICFDSGPEWPGQAGGIRKARALETEIRLGQQRVQLLQKVKRAGTWELDIVNDTFSFSSAAAKLMGFQCSSRVRLGQLLDLMYHSGDREVVSSKLKETQRRRRDFTTTFRVRDGNETRILEMRGKTFYNAGWPLMLGVLSDVTPARATSASKGRAVFANGPQARLA